MSWDDHNRRRTAIRAVLDFAAEHPGMGLGYDHVPEAHENYRDRRELVLALQHDWTQALWAQIELISRDPRRCHLGATKIARVAWAETAERNPVLRRLLDVHRDEIGPSALREEDLLIATGHGLSTGQDLSTGHDLSTGGAASACAASACAVA